MVAAVPDDPGGVRRELLPGADHELRPGARHRRRGFHRGGTGIEKTYVFTGAGAFTVNDDRAIPPWGINGGRHGGRSTKTLVRASGEVVELPLEDRPGPGRRRRHARLPDRRRRWLGRPARSRSPLVLRDVLRDLVSPRLRATRLRRRHRRERRRRRAATTPSAPDTARSADPSSRSTSATSPRRTCS